MSGNVELAKVINVSIDALLNSYRNDSIPGAGSGGLMSDGYAGNLLWDVETWMLPVFTFFWPTIARRILHYRAVRMNEARKYAKSGKVDPFLPGRTFDGIAYPWMSALSGAEENPGQNE